VVESTSYIHLGPREGSASQQYFVNGRSLRSETLFRATVGPEPMTPEEVAQDYDVPVEAVREANHYCLRNAALLQKEREEDWAESRTRGLMVRSMEDDFLGEFTRRRDRSSIDPEGGIAMAAPPARNPLSLQQILEAVDHLSPAQMGELERRLAARRAENGNALLDEATLVRAAGCRLAAAAERRLKALIVRSERGTLTPSQLTEYQALAQEAQRLDAVRAQAIVELARRSGKSVRAVKAEIGCEAGKDGT